MVLSIAFSHEKVSLFLDMDLHSPYSAPLSGEAYTWAPAGCFKGKMSGLGAFPGEICWIEVWIDMWALERSVEV
jgi:hypothetical protein